MRKCVFLSMDNLDGFPVDGRLVYEPLTRLGWEVCEISWHCRDVDWGQFDLAVIRSTWDYQYHLAEYLSFLKQLQASGVRLENAYETIRWNIDKQYLRDLEQQQISIVPTLWPTSTDTTRLQAAFHQLETRKIIVKPTISASAFDTFLLTDDDLPLMAEIERRAAGRSFMIQPFMEAVVDPGEYSLVFLGGHYSHAVIKRPGPGEFRVQEEYGGTNARIEPDRRLLEKAVRALRAVEKVPLYARVDFVRQGQAWLLMELELVEPSLYLDLDRYAPGRFARVIDRWVK